MRNLALALMLAQTLALAETAPAFAGFGTIELPRLDWPTEGAVTGSTKGCVAAPGATPVGVPCR